jgi:glucokinase
VGVGKLEALYGVDLRSELADELDLGVPEIRFLNDAEAFLLGEAAAGAARGHDLAVGITLGTGLGSAFLSGGRLVREGPHVPPGGDLHVVPFRGLPVENAISGRGIAARLDGQATAAGVAARAAGGDADAVAALHAFGTDLAEFLEPWLRAFRPTCVVVGGSIVRAWRYFHAPLPATAAPAARPDDAAMIGAARWATGGRVSNGYEGGDR